MELNDTSIFSWISLLSSFSLWPLLSQLLTGFSTLSHCPRSGVLEVEKPEAEIQVHVIY